MEKNVSINASFQINGTGISRQVTGQIQIKQNDDEMGESLIEYCDDADGYFDYQTGTIKFNVKQR